MLLIRDGCRFWTLITNRTCDYASNRFCYRSLPLGVLLAPELFDLLFAAVRYVNPRAKVDLFESWISLFNLLHRRHTWRNLIVGNSELLPQNLKGKMRCNTRSNSFSSIGFLM
jgi:hypothetical protein